MVMMKLVVGADKQKLQYVTHESGIGKNAQEIIPVASDDGSLTFLIPCYGGEQKSDGTTNGVESRIDKVVVHFGNPDSDPDTSSMTHTTLITGDPLPPTTDPPTPPTAYDIRSLAARLGGGWLYTLCGTMNNDVKRTQNWTIYKADLAKLLALEPTPDPSNSSDPPPDPPTAPLTLTEAVAAKIMEDIDWGAGDPGYYWDICIEAGIDITGDRLWFLKGSDIKVTGAEEYNDDIKNFNPGYGIGELGGLNVNCAAFIAETLRQAALGLSLKRGLYGSMAPIVSAASQGQTIKY
jgi:hypothetical protein